MQLWVPFALLLALLVSSSSAGFSIAPCSPNCYVEQNEPIQIRILIDNSTTNPPESQDWFEILAISSPAVQDPVFLGATGLNVVYNVNTSVVVSFVPAQIGMIGAIRISFSYFFNNSGSIESVLVADTSDTGLFVFDVRSSGISPTSYGFQLSFPLLAATPIQSLQLGSSRTSGRVFTGSTVVRQSTSGTSRTATVVDAQEIALGFPLGQQVFCNMTLSNGNVTSFFLVNVTVPQPQLPSRSPSFLPPDSGAGRFPVPTNVSMLPSESAVVNRLEFVWEGGGFLCQTPAVSNIGNDFYALICLSGSDVLAAGRGLVISLIASVDYQYVTSKTGTPIGYALGGVPFVNPPADGPFVWFTNDPPQPVVQVTGGFFYSIDPASNVFDVTIGNITGFRCDGFFATNDSVDCFISGPVAIPRESNITFTRLVTNNLVVSIPNITLAVSYPRTNTTRPVRPRAPAAPPTQEAARGLQAGEIAGIAVVAVVAVVLIIVIIVLIRRRMNASDDSDGSYSDDDDGDDASTPMQSAPSGDGALPANGGGDDSS